MLCDTPDFFFSLFLFFNLFLIQFPHTPDTNGLPCSTRYPPPRAKHHSPASPHRRQASVDLKHGFLRSNQFDPPFLLPLYCSTDGYKISVKNGNLTEILCLRGIISSRKSELSTRRLLMHILVVEDERALCETIVRSLRRLAYSVDYCHDGEQSD